MFIKTKKYSVNMRLLLCLILGLLVVACTSSAPPPQVIETPVIVTESRIRDASKTLRLVFWQAPTILNPHLSNAVRDSEASRIVYEPLASFDQSGNLIPFLAAEIPSLENGGVASDGFSVTWKLKEGVRWADGEPFTAADVLFTFEFIHNPDIVAVSSSNYSAVAGVEIINDYTVKVNFNDVTPAWWVPFVGKWGMILPRHRFETYSGPLDDRQRLEENPNQFPVGTGPYYAVSNKPQETLFLGNDLVQTNKITFEPNPFFREQGKPFFEQVVLMGGGTVNEAIRLLLITGEADFALNLLPTEELLELEEAGPGRLILNFGSKVQKLALNFSDPNHVTRDGERSNMAFPHPFFEDARVRQAFSYAIDRERIAALYGVAGQTTSNFLVAPLNFASPNTAFEFNLEKAAALLDEAGWIDSNGGGFRDKNNHRMKVTYLTFLDPVVQATQAIIKNDLESLGIEVELRPVEAGTFYSSGQNPNSVFLFDADIEEFSLENVTPDPGTIMFAWQCAQIPQKENNWSAGLNMQRWCNPEYDALYRQSTTELDPEKRRQLFIAMNDMLMEEVVMIPLVHLADVSSISRSIENVGEPTPWDSILWNIKDWRRSSP